MNSKDSKGIETKSGGNNNSENGLELLKVIRESFRTPKDESDKVTVQINDKDFEVVNIGSQGIGILIPQEDMFYVNEKLRSIKLTWQGNPFSLQGKVVHISPDDSGNYLCGIQLINLDKKSEKKLKKYLQGNRSALFGKK